MGGILIPTTLKSSGSRTKFYGYQGSRQEGAEIMIVSCLAASGNFLRLQFFSPSVILCVCPKPFHSAGINERDIQARRKKW